LELPSTAVDIAATAQVLTIANRVSYCKQIVHQRSYLK